MPIACSVMTMRSFEEPHGMLYKAPNLKGSPFSWFKIPLKPLSLSLFVFLTNLCRILQGNITKIAIHRKPPFRSSKFKHSVGKVKIDQRSVHTVVIINL